MMDSQSKKASAVIDMMQQFQFRALPLPILEENLSKFQYKDTFGKLASLIWENKIPNLCPDKTQINLIGDNLLTEKLFSPSKELNLADNRLNKVIFLLEKNLFSIPRAYEVFDNLHYREAKFYRDLLTGCKFGLSDKFMKKHFNYIAPDKPIKWMKPKISFSKKKDFSFPVVGEEMYEGFLFKYVKKEGTSYIFNEHGMDKRECFPMLKRISKIVPNDRGVFIDFIVAPNSNLEYSLIMGDLANFRPVDKGNIILLDMYFDDNDDSNLLIRKKRLVKLVKKWGDRKADNINIVPFTILNNKEDLLNFAKKISTKPSGGILKEGLSTYFAGATKSYVACYAKHGTQPAKIVDYSYKLTPQLELDYVCCHTMNSNILYVSKTTLQEKMLIANLPNYVGKTVKIDWEVQSGEHIPVITRVF